MKRVMSWSIVCLLLARTASPTVVAPVSFDQMVAEAETIFVAEAVDLRSAWETSAGSRSIVTLVTFDVQQVLKGQVGLRTQLRFLGGTIGDLTERVSDMPQFKVGDRDVLFVSPEKNAASPLVGFWQGRFRLQTDAAGNSIVRTSEGDPLLLGLGTGPRLGTDAAARGPLRQTELEAIVRDRVRAARVR